jgi:hypothetical protein
MRAVISPTHSIICRGYENKKFQHQKYFVDFCVAEFIKQKL